MLVAVVLAIPPDRGFPPLSERLVERRLEVRDGRDRWLFLVQRLEVDQDRYPWLPYRMVSVSKNGRYVCPPWRPADDWLPNGNFFKFSRPRIRSASPIVAIRAHYGLGMNWDTRFYRLYHGRLQMMGSPPAINSNGPVRWRGRPNYWLFDNEDFYAMRDEKDWRYRYSLYRFGRDGRFKFMREWNAPRDMPLPDTVRLSDW